ncbi:60S ribosomal protein L28 [Aphelenchoides fujianensis]|nr:60S ribosomal protein L28 [Aphelenchoides fujianensis]
MAKTEENAESEATFFSGKLRLHRQNFLDASGDVLVVPCSPDLLSGGEIFKDVTDHAGPALPGALRPFVCLEAGSCKMTAALNLKNYKELAMCVLPELFPGEGLTRMDRVKVSMCIADALDLSAEAGHQAVAFTHWSVASIEQSAEILLLCIAHWVRNSVYAEKLTNISLFLEPEIFDAYCHVAKVIDEDTSLVLDVLQSGKVEEFPLEVGVEEEMRENGPHEYGELKPLARSRGPIERRSGGQPPNAPFLFYSRNLSTSILSIEQDGNIQQYRLSTTVYEKNTHYFRCSRCDYLSRMNPSQGQYRPKITLRDGQIVSEKFPIHHPDCKGTSKEVFVVQQLDRLWKAIAIYETEELRSCYVALRDVAKKEAAELYAEMETPKGKYPEWELLRQTAEKYHNQYSMRLITCSYDELPPGHMSGLNMDQYSEIRRVEGELDGLGERGRVWLTEGVELERDDHEEEEPAEATSSGVTTRANAPVVSKRVVSVTKADETRTTIEVRKTAAEPESPSRRPQRTIKPTFKVKAQAFPLVRSAIMVRVNNASPAIQWAVIRKNSAFLHKRRGVGKFFSSDKFNLTGKYTIRSSGVANRSGVSVRVSDDKKGLIVETKKKGRGAVQRPVSATNSVQLNGHARAVVRSVGKLVKGYEPRLRASAQRRASQLLRSIKPRQKAGKNRRNKAAAQSTA